MTTPPPGGTTLLGARRVPRIGYGAMQLRDIAPDVAAAVLRRAADRGVRVIDTAAFYGPGTVNERIRKALAPYDADLVIVTKVGATATDGPVPLRLAQRPEELRQEVHRNLATLGAERLDVVHLRRADIPPSPAVEGEQVVPIEDQLAELMALRDAGLIGAIGLGNASTEHLRTALPAGLVSVQNAHNLLHRDTEDQLGICAEHGIVWMPYFPLGSAFDHLPSVVDAPAVREVAGRTGATPAQVGLAWLLARTPEVVLIPGTGSTAHLDENLAAGGVHLTEDDLTLLGTAT